jgi:hypothetical protein
MVIPNRSLKNRERVTSSGSSWFIWVEQLKEAICFCVGNREWINPAAHAESIKMWTKRIAIGATILFTCLFGKVQAQQYTTSKLVRNLLKMEYPLNKDDVIALNRIGMRFDSKNRITVLEKILQDRERIHSRNDIDYFLKTEVVCDALRLLDEHDLPVVSALIYELNEQKGWEKREQLLLAYMAAKRDIRYQSNVAYLLSVLPQSGSDLERFFGGEASLAIIDTMNYLSYLADLFIYRGDTEILNSLIRYSTRSHGFPAEYLSHMFVEMFLVRPKAFISTLAGKDEQTVNSIITSLVFGIRNNQLREKVKGVLQKDLFTTAERNQRSIEVTIDKLHKQIDLTIREIVPNVPDSPANSEIGTTK